MLRSFIEPIRSRRASVALYVALLAPVLSMAVGLGVEVSSWSAAKVKLQRIADTSAMAGMLDYNHLSNAQDAAKAADNLAQVNLGASTTNQSWNANTKTLTDNNVTVALVNGVKSSSDTAVQVTVNQTIPLTISRIVAKNTSSVTVSTNSTAELVGVQGAGSGGQPCMVALSKSGSGITASGSITLNASGCTAVSNVNFNDSGGSTLTLAGIYAVGTITLPCWADLNGNSSNCPVWPSNGMIYSNSYLHPGSSAITDPYASNTTLQTALTNVSSNTASGGTAITCSNESCTGLSNGSTCTGTSGVTCTIKPGTYAGLTVTGGGPFTFNFSAGSYTFTGNIAFSGADNYVNLQPGNYRGLAVTGGLTNICLAPGLYSFNGNINLTNNTTTADRSLTINGTTISCPSTDTGGVTILTSGTFNGANTFNFDVTAPSTSQAGSTGGIAGVVLAGLTSDPSGGYGFTMSGNPQLWVTGVVYFPNATIDSGGSTGLGGSSTSCLEVVAGSILLSGSTTMGSACSSVNAATFYSQPGATTYTAQVVQ